MVMVSHDIPDIFHYCHYVAVVHAGKVVETGAPDEVRNSINPFVRQLVDGAAEGPIQLV
jgi:phospholipid/cholesterol/gamma-HCH transport system ATP-binding protein